MSIIVNNLIANAINHTKNRCTRARNIGNNQIEVSYYLSIPIWIKDTDLIKDENCFIVYAANKKKKINKFIVDLKLAFHSNYYPQVSNNKFFCYKQKYDVSNWLKSDFDIQLFLSSEREKNLREIKSNILLEKIGNLTKQWNDVTSGKYPEKTLVNYGLSRMDSFNTSFTTTGGNVVNVTNYTTPNGYIKF